jgi:hypothetical protein
LIEDKEPLKLSEIPNRAPAAPMNTREPSGKTSNLMLDEALPVNWIEAFNDPLLFGNIIMSDIPINID